MKIKIYNFTLVPPNESIDRFDLYEEYQGTTKAGKKKNYQRCIGYKMTLESCVGTIIRMGLADDFADETITLKQYVDEYKRIKSDIDNILK